MIGKGPSNGIQLLNSSRPQAVLRCKAKKHNKNGEPAGRSVAPIDPRSFFVQAVF